MDLEAELAANDALPSPLSTEQLTGLKADLLRAQREYADDGEAFLAECLIIVARWGARGGRLYASARIDELRTENAGVWRIMKQLAYRVDSLEQLIGAGLSGLRH